MRPGAGRGSIAFNHDCGGHHSSLQHHIAANLPAGWSLVTIPTGGINTANVDAVIKVGAQVGMESDDENRNGSGDGVGQFSWFKDEDGSLPTTLEAGEAVFVHSSKGGALKN